MAILICKKCSHIREVGNQYLGKSVKCPKCEKGTTIRDTVGVFKTLIKKHYIQNKELQELRQESSENGPDNEISENISFEEVDIYNTNIFTQANNLQPIQQWFEKREIQIQVNPDTVDTTGFFDEIALLIGNNFTVLNYVTN